jgi:ribonuclease BN (tRNA processing enzyme)
MHPTGREAGRLATVANARSLILLHLSVATDPANVLADARETFAGPCALAQDCETYQV